MGRMASPRRTPIPSTPNESPAMSKAITNATDEQIRTTVESIRDPDTVPAFSNGYYTLTPDELRRAILALRPAVEPMTPDQRKIDQAVHEAVSAIYFADGADYLRALWSVVRGLSPDLSRVLELDGEIAWNISEQITTAIGITAKAEDAHQHTKEAE